MNSSPGKAGFLFVKLKLNDMKTFITAVLTLTVVIVISGIVSCSKKDKLDDPKKVVVGYWKGKYGASSTSLTQSWEFLFRSDGTLRVFDGADTTTTTGKGEGTYTIADSVVMTHFAFFVNPSYIFSSTGVLNTNDTKMTGTYGRPGSSGTGYFFLDKQ
jgi:hypothetical protein